MGTSDGAIVKWYDQSGNGFDLEQISPAYQPYIMLAGSMLTLSGLPSIEFGMNAAGNTLLQATATTVFPGISNFTANAVANLTGATSDGYGRLVDLQFTGDTNDYTNTTSAIPLVQNGSDLTSMYGYRKPAGFLSHATLTAASPTVLTSTNNGGTMTIYGNGLAGSAGANYGGNYALGSAIWINVGNWSSSAGNPITGGGNDSFNGHQSELILFPTSLSTGDRQILEHDQESYYSISGI